MKSKARQMTEAETAWLAGLFDGEGSIILRQRHRPSGGSLVITITNTCLLLLERVVEVTGCTTIIHNPRDNPRWADCYVWQVGSASAIDLLTQMRPWLIVKAERADDAIAGRVFARDPRWDTIYPETIAKAV